jgi:glycosyltransferase involved in cell wall biosynthesis
MKIVQYMLGFRSRDGGVVRALIDLCNALAARGHDVRALTTDASDAPRNWDGREGRPLLQVLPFHRIGEGVLTSESKRVAREAIMWADVVHLHVPWDMICLQLGWIAQKFRVPYIVTVHGMLDDWTMASAAMKKRLYLALAGRKFLERAQGVQSAAQIEGEQSVRWYPRGKSIVIPLLFDFGEFEKLPGPQRALREFDLQDDGRPCVLFLGRLHPIKRVELVIRAVAELKRQGCAARLLIAGSGDAKYEAELRQLVQREGLESDARFLGFVSGETKLSLYQHAHVAVLPSAHESFGYSLVEALACGTPVIATTGVNIWRELEQTGGATIAAAEPSSITNAIREIITNQQHRNHMGQKGCEGIRAWLDPHRVIQQYETMYRQAISTR